MKVLIFVAAFLFSNSVWADDISAVNALKSEPAIKDMIYQKGQAVEWQIGVLPTGNRRTGYASYVCGVLKDHGVGEGRVRIVDIVRVKNGVRLKDASLGAMDCSNWRVFER